MKKLILIVFCMYTLSVNAQNTLRPNTYFQNMHYYNVSAGLNNADANYHFSAYGKYKFIDNDLWKKNMNLYVNHIGKLNVIPGFYSAAFICDNYSFYSRNTLHAGYSHQLNVTQTGTLSIGARAVLNFDNVNWDKLTQADDKSGSVMYFSPDLDLGIQYQNERLTVGISAKNLFANSTKIDGEDLLKNQREWYAYIAYLFHAGQHITISPYTLLSLERKFSIDLGVGASFYNFVNLSYHFRLDGLRNVGSIGFNIFKNVQLGVAMDQSLIHKDHNLEWWVGYSF